MANLKVEHLWHWFVSSPHCTCLSFCWMSLHCLQVCCTSLGKWMFTIVAKSFQFCFFIKFMLKSQFLFSNLSSKNEKVALFQNLLAKFFSSTTTSLSWVVALCSFAWKNNYKKLGCSNTSPSSKISMDKSSLEIQNNPNLFFVIMQQCRTTLTCYVLWRNSAK